MIWLRLWSVLMEMGLRVRIAMPQSLRKAFMIGNDANLVSAQVR